MYIHTVSRRHIFMISHDPSLHGSMCIRLLTTKRHAAFLSYIIRSIVLPPSQLLANLVLSTHNNVIHCNGCITLWVLISVTLELFWVYYFIRCHAMLLTDLRVDILLQLFQFLEVEDAISFSMVSYCHYALIGFWICIPRCLGVSIMYFKLTSVLAWSKRLPKPDKPDLFRARPMKI